MSASPTSGVTLNTPGGQPQLTPSPLSNEEQAYRDKVKELSRYIEPLRKMISRLGPGGKHFIPLLSIVVRLRNRILCFRSRENA